MLGQRHGGIDAETVLGPAVIDRGFRICPDGCAVERRGRSRLRRRDQHPETCGCRCSGRYRSASDSSLRAAPSRSHGIPRSGPRSRHHYTSLSLSMERCASSRQRCRRPSQLRTILRARRRRPIYPASWLLARRRRGRSDLRSAQESRAFSSHCICQGPSSMANSRIRLYDAVDTKIDAAVVARTACGERLLSPLSSPAADCYAGPARDSSAGSFRSRNARSCSRLELRTLSRPHL